MKLIEDKLHELHADARDRGVVTGGATRERDQIKAFARVSLVSERSPASAAVRGYY